MSSTKCEISPIAKRIIGLSDSYATDKAFLNKCEITNLSFITDLKKGRTKMPGADKLAQIVRGTGCSGTWLLTGEGEKYPPEPRSNKAAEAQSYLEQLAQKDQIDPFSDSFNPKSILKSWKKKKRKKSRNNNINTMRKAADYFYRKKAHLSNKTVNLDAKKPSQWGAYQRAVEHFISINEIADLPPKAVRA